MLTIHNRHPAACGIPPDVSTEAADLCIGYFENRYGEQWIFTFDRETRQASVRGGDVGWATVHVVRDGQVDGLILAPEEAARLRAGPGWRRRSPMRVLGDRSLGDLETQLQEFPVNPGRAPER